MSAYDFCYSYFSQLQYSNMNKDIKVCFSNEPIIKSKESKALYHRQAEFFYVQSFLHFLLCIAISHFHNNEYAIISGLTRWGIDSENKLYWVCFVNFFWLKHLHRISYIKLESIHGSSSKYFFILVLSFSIYLWDFFFDVTFFVLLLYLLYKM